MTFYSYMTRNYLDDVSPKGKLARDIRDDKDQFPRNGLGKFKGWHKYLRDYLESCRADQKYLDVFEDCWKEYEQCERRRLNRRL